MNHLVKINLFGGMYVEIDNEPILNSVNKLHRHWKLLAYLVANKNTSLSSEQLSNAIYGEEEDITNAQNALKNSVYCLRKELGDNSIIIFEDGCYKWNKENNLILDTEIFNNIITTIQSVDDINDKLNLYKDIITLYNGEFLPQLHKEPWVIEQSSYYKNIFIDTVLQYFEVLFKNKQYNDILSIANRVTFIEPYNEDFYLYIFKSLYYLNMYSLIVSNYMQINKIFLTEFGEELCEEIKKIYERASKKLNRIELDISVIKDNLKESIDDETPIKGPYFCSFEVFKQIYQMNVRTAAREDRSIILVLLTIADTCGDIPDNKMLLDSMLELREALNNTIRKNDVYTQYSKAQYLLMLSTDTVDKAQIAIKRIEDNYNQYLNKNHLTLISKVSQQDFI